MSYARACYFVSACVGCGLPGWRLSLLLGCVRSASAFLCPRSQADRARAEAAAAREAVELILARLRPRKHATVLRLRHRLDERSGGAAGADVSNAYEVAELDFASLGRRLGVSRQRAQQLYHAAVACARQEAAAAGLA